jgi:hypothetical protein
VICPKCRAETTEVTGACPSCGAPLDAGPAAAGVPPYGAAGPGTSATATPAATSFAFDAKRWSQADRIVGGATLVLFISLFLPWFGVNFGAGSITVDGLWHGWMYIVLILSLALMAYLVIRAGFKEMPFRLPLTHTQLLLAVTGLSAFLTLLSFIFKPSGTGWQFGAFVGLIAALVAVAPMALPAIKAKTAQHG